MPRITNIQARKGTATDWSTQNPVLASGELGYDLTNKILKLGDGTSSWTSLSSINLSSSNITDFNSSVSGLLPVKDIVAGSNITVSSSSGTYTINSTGVLTQATADARYVELSGDTMTGGLAINADTPLTVTGGRTFLSPNSEPYGLGVKYVSTGGAVYFGATDSTATPGMQISKAGGVAMMTITNAGAAAIPGTLTVGGSAVATVASLLPHLGGSTASVDVYPRTEIINAAIQYGTSGNMLLVFFTPLQTVTVSQITMVSGTTAASGLTLAQMGLYTFDETTVTLVARCASDTTLFTTINTAYTRSLNTTGGYPATYTLQAGTRYGVALLLIGTTMPTFSGKGIAAGALALSPRTSYIVAGQTALPTTSSTFSITANHPFARLS